MTHKGTVTLETERLILRQFTSDDAEAMFRNWCNNPEVTKFLMWSTHKNVEETRQISEKWVAAYEQPDTYQWAIVPKDFGEPIGSIAVVHKNDELKMVHIGYCIGKAWWHLGYMSEALTELVRFFFENVGVNRVESRHDSRNPNSGKVMLKAGLKFEGTLRQSDINNQGVCDAVYYAILEEDYFGKTQPEPKGYIMDLRKIVGHRPLIQVGASIIVDNGKGDILLELRKDNGEWDYPSGSMDLGESLDETAKRELLEETGLTALKLELYDFTHNETARYVYPNGDEVYNVTARYVCTEFSGELHPQESEIAKLRWFSFDALPENLRPRKIERIKEYLLWRRDRKEKFSSLTIAE